MFITIRLELQYQGDKARKMNHDRDPGHRVLPWSPYDPTRNKLPEGAFSWRKMLDSDLSALEFGHPETVNYVKQSAKIFCNYVVEENGPSHRSLCARVAQLEKPSMRGFKEHTSLKYVKIISSRYERRRERDPESEERTRRSVSPGPPRKRSRTDVDPPSSHSAYQRPRSPSPRPHLPPPRYPAAASHHQPPQTPTPSARSRQDDRYKPTPRLSQTPQSSFSAQTLARTDTNDSQNHTSTSTAPLKISSVLATLSSSTALSSMLSRTDGVEPPPRTARSISQSSVPPSSSALVSGMSTAQFDLAKLQSLSQALQNHGTISTASTDGNSNPNITKPAAAPTEPRSIHPIITERSSSSLMEKVSEPYREYTCPNVQNEGGSHERRGSTSSRTSERPQYSGSYRKENIGPPPDRPHSGDREMARITRKRSRSPVPIPRAPSHVRTRSPVHQSWDAGRSDVQVLPYDERERARNLERDRERERELVREREEERDREFERERNREKEKERERERERERKRERQVSNDLNGVHPSRKALIDDVQHREIWTAKSSTSDGDNIKSLQDELATAKMALAQAKEELEVQKRLLAEERRAAATYAQKYLLLRERSQLARDTLQIDLKSEKRKNEELEQVVSDLQREMTSPKMAPEVLDALVKIAGMSIRVRDALDRGGATT